jgi:hypothetical protein
MQQASVGRISPSEPVHDAKHGTLRWLKSSLSKHGTFFAYGFVETILFTYFILV